MDSLDDEQLRTYRFELYDRGDLVSPGSDVYARLRAALDAVYAAERARDLMAGLRLVCRVAAPDADPDAFADSVVALARAQVELGSHDAGAVFRGAFEVATAINRKKGQR